MTLYSEAHNAHLSIIGGVDLDYPVQVLSALSTCFSLQLVNKPSLGHMLRPGEYPTPYHISPLRFSTHFPEPVFTMMAA